MCFGCSKEPSHQDDSFEHPQHIVSLRNKKTNFQLHILNWGPDLLHYVTCAPAKFEVAWSNSLGEAFTRKYIIIPPRKLCLWWGILFSHRACVRPSVTFCFLNILKSHCWIFIKPCKHVHICKTNTLNKKVRARDQF